MGRFYQEWHGFGHAIYRQPSGSHGLVGTQNEVKMAMPGGGRMLE